MVTRSEAVDYRLRPAKTIERKMLAEACARLEPFAPVSEYQYVGMGAVHFRDFILFHRQLRIHRMTSIEVNGALERRIRFNRPYSCIDIAMGHSNSVLPRVDWSVPTIAWMDYNGTLTANERDDLAVIFSKALSGSIVIVTVNAEPSRAATERLKAAFGEERVQIGPDESLLRYEFASIQSALIAREIEEAIRERNRPLAPQAQFHFEQLFNFHYRDEVRMLTVGGMVFLEDDRARSESCDFDSLDFVRRGIEAFEIRVPTLTLRELQHLDRNLPTDDEEVLQQIASDTGLGKIDVSKYADLYRYYPTFAEANF